MVVLILLLLNGVLLIKVKYLNTEVKEIGIFYDRLLNENNSLRGNIPKYYTEPCQGRSLQGNSISGSESGTLIFVMWSNACGSCVKEQLEIIGEQYISLKGRGIGIRVISDQQVIEHIPDGIPKEAWTDPQFFPLLGRLVSSQSAYYYWLDNNQASHVFFPVPHLEQLTDDYFQFIIDRYGTYD